MGFLCGDSKDPSTMVGAPFGDNGSTFILVGARVPTSRPIYWCQLALKMLNWANSGTWVAYGGHRVSI